MTGAATHDRRPSHRRAVWAFPALVLVAVTVLTALSLNGSSVGIYHRDLHGPTVDDPDLLLGTPRPIRSDEWLGWTPFTVLQEESGYPAFNDRLGGDGDLTKNAEIPERHWTALFRPAHWPFLVLPFEQALALRWWGVMAALALSCYAFCVRLLAGRPVLSALLASSFAISPFVMWWYQANLFLSLAYGFLLVLLGRSVLDRARVRAQPQARDRVARAPRAGPVLTVTLQVLGTAYLTAALALTMYPPYALPVFLGACAYLAGYAISRRSRPYRLGHTLRQVYPLVLGGFAGLGVVAAYAAGHQEMIRATAESLYPGQRRVVSGDLDPRALLDSFLMPLLQVGERGGSYYDNQSEASGFILLLPFLLVPALVVQAVELRARRRVDWPLAATNACALLFLARALVPVDLVVYDLLLLDRVPNTRLQAGIGFVGFVQLVLLVRALARVRPPRVVQLVVAGAAGAGTAAATLAVGVDTVERYPGFVSEPWLVLVLALPFVAMVPLYLLQRPVAATALLLAVSLASSLFVTPLYRGAGELRDGALVTAIREVSRPDQAWGTVDNLYYSNMPLAAGRPQVTGSQIYPDPDFWSQVAGTEYEEVYNRQARSEFVTSATLTEPLALRRVNYFVIRLECSGFLTEHVDFLLAVAPLQEPCLALERTVPYPRTTFYLYRVRS